MKKLFLALAFTIPLAAYAEGEAAKVPTPPPAVPVPGKPVEPAKPSEPAAKTEPLPPVAAGPAATDKPQEIVIPKGMTLVSCAAVNNLLIYMADRSSGVAAQIVAILTQANSSPSCK